MYVMVFKLSQKNMNLKCSKGLKFWVPRLQWIKTGSKISWEQENSSLCQSRVNTIPAYTCCENLEVFQTGKPNTISCLQVNCSQAWIKGNYLSSWTDSPRYKSAVQWLILTRNSIRHIIICSGKCMKSLVRMSSKGNCLIACKCMYEKVPASALLNLLVLQWRLK